MNAMVRTALTVALALLALLAAVGPASAAQKKLLASDGAAGEHFGRSVAVDGTTLVVGAPEAAGARGAVYVFSRSGEDWTQTAKLTASDGAVGDHLGQSVAIDGGIVVAGSPAGNNGSPGAVYTFASTGAAARTETAKLTAADGTDGDSLGIGVDIDGDTIVAGAPGEDIGVPYDAGHGAIYTFASTGASSRNQTAKLTASDNTNTGFIFAGSSLGYAVAIDGDTIVAGAPSDNFQNPTGPRHGSVYTFSRTGASQRTETAKLTVTGSGRLGEAVDIAGDTIVAGDTEFNDAFGAAFTFARTGAAQRNQTGTLTPANPRQNSGFGRSISMSENFIAIAAPTYSAGGAASSVGEGYLFTRSGPANRSETWDFGGSDRTGGESFGTSIVVDDDRVLAGAPFVDSVSPFVQDRGAVYSLIPDITASKVGPGSGTISSSPAGINNCAGTCSAAFTLGQQVTLTASPGGGSFFAGWENFSGCSGTGNCVFTVTGVPQIAGRFNVGAPDTTPPETTISGGPAAGSTVTSASVTFSFDANELSTFECRYDGASFAPCSSPGPGAAGSDTRTLAEGTHTFEVRAKDSSNNIDPSPAARTFTVDLPAPPPPPPDKTPPQTTITKAPPAKVKSKKLPVSVSVSFASNEAGSTFRCSVDGGAPAACSSPATFKLGKGEHTIAVSARDRAGNTDASPATATVKVEKKKRKKRGGKGGKGR